MSILVLDVGSSSVRALLIDEALKTIKGTIARREFSFDYEPSGAAQGDAVNLRGLLESCIDEVLQSPDAASIKAVGMATFAGNLIGVDESNTPLTPIYTYADSRSASDLETLREVVDVSAAYERTGCPHHTAYHPARLHWLYRTQAGAALEVSTWLDFGTYCYRAWFGADTMPCSYSIASWSGLLNRYELAWDAQWLEVLQLSPEMFPPLADFDAAQTGLSATYARRWPLLKETPFYLAVGDGAAANVGSAAMGSESAALTVGTTSALRVALYQGASSMPPAVPRGLWGYRITHDLHLIGGALTEGGSIYAWARRTFSLNDAAIEAALMSCEPDAHGLTVLPLLAGERSPGFMPSATGTIHGLTLATEPLEIVQALMESVALRLCLIAGDLLTPSAQIYAGGGALESQAWTQMIANALGRPLNLLENGEVTARGMAALIIGPERMSPPPVKQIVTPDFRAHTIYDAALKRQTALYTKLFGPALL